MKVSIVPCEDYERVASSIGSLLHELGNDFFKPNQKILIKPNLLTAKSKGEAVTTHPEIIRAVILIAKKAGSEVYVADSPAFQSLKHVAEISGILDVCRETGAELISFNETFTHKVNGKVMRSFDLAKALNHFDLVVNIPKLKTHSLTQYTGAVKNLFGLIPGKDKSKMHVRFSSAELFSEMLLDLYCAFKPGLHIMDAVVGMEGNGPSGGEPRNIGYLLGSRDALALDNVATRMVSLNPPLIKLARQRGLRYAFDENIEVDKIPTIENFKKPKGSWADKIPKFVKNGGKNIFLAKPVIDRDKCIKCADCVTICPVGALSMRNDKPMFDYSKCIRCYCCQEVCPAKAIYLKNNFLSKKFS